MRRWTANGVTFREAFVNVILVATKVSRPRAILLRHHAGREGYVLHRVRGRPDAQPARERQRADARGCHARILVLVASLARLNILIAAWRVRLERHSARRGCVVEQALGRRRRFFL